MGFKTVGDNFDKNVRRRHQTIEHQTKSYHCYHSYAARDRVDVSGLSNWAPTEIGIVDFRKFLPTRDEIGSVLDNFKVYIQRCTIYMQIEQQNNHSCDHYSSFHTMHTFMYICRILTQNMSKFEKEGKSVAWHIPHRHSVEMSKKSTVVST